MSISYRGAFPKNWISRSCVSNPSIKKEAE
jgi:hypothetical protein